MKKYGGITNYFSFCGLNETVTLQINQLIAQMYLNTGEFEGTVDHVLMIFQFYKMQKL